ncbi:hypothetical protein [Chitinimonas sp. JJ19]|uniref:hypothetical protein n=1 Tax=Chitinimonas sp. JJ19 TaxID=3109352 RepID=UPI001A490ACE|nr:hypothetical protein [Chitinimonas sp.]
MSIRKSILLLGLVALLTACGEPVPAAKAAYVGEWQAANMYLSISQEGSVAYKRVDGSTSKSVNGPLQGFEGDNFEVGVGPMSTTFVVSVPPREVAGKWQMTVDGVVLTRQD